MTHKGIEYTVAMTAVPSIWKWQFQIGDTVKTGTTETRINLLAIRRVQLRIDRELKKTRTASLRSSTERAHPQFNNPSTMRPGSERRDGCANSSCRGNTG
jgi:hypothetical protein